MIKNKTLHAFVTAILLLLGAGSSRPAFAWFSSTYIESGRVDTSTLTVSASTTTPTVLAKATTSGATVQLWCQQKANAGETIMVLSSTSGFSTSLATGTARIPCAPTTVAPFVFTLTDYSGPIYALNGSSYTIPINYIR